MGDMSVEGSVKFTGLKDGALSFLEGFSLGKLTVD